MEANLEVLKLRLLLGRLEQVSKANLHAHIIREAHLSSALARATGYPLLLFPCLFEERATAALDQGEQLEDRYWQQFARPNTEKVAVLSPI